MSQWYAAHNLCPYPELFERAHSTQIHISNAKAPEEDPSLASEALKLMHRFTPEQVKAKMDEAEKS